jgi:hypothetical protein
MILVDTSGVLASLDSGERHHRSALRELRIPRVRLLSPMVLTELDYLLGVRAGAAAQRALLADVAAGTYRLEPFDAADVRESVAILDRYRDLDLGLADASLVVLARRHDVTEILTLDERHFRVVRGPGDRPFRLLPADAA